MDSETEKVIDAAFTFATFAAFAIPGYGVFIAGGLAVGQRLFEQYNSHSGLTTSTIADCLRRIIDREAIRDATDLTEIVSRHIESHFERDGHLSFALPESVEDTMRDHPYGPFANFYTLLRRIVYDDVLGPRIASLVHDTAGDSSASRAVLGLNDFMHGVSVYLTAYSLMKMIEDKGGIEFDISTARNVQTSLKIWIEHAQKIASRNDQQISDRVALVSEIEDDYDSRPANFVDISPRGILDMIEQRIGLSDVTPGIVTCFRDAGPNRPIIKDDENWISNLTSPRVMPLDPTVVYAVHGRVGEKNIDLISSIQAEYLSDIVTKMRDAQGCYRPSKTWKIIDSWMDVEENLGKRIAHETEKSPTS